MIIRRLCVLLDAETVYRKLSTILQGEPDLDFASIMVQVSALRSVHCISCPPIESLVVWYNFLKYLRVANWC